GQPSLLFHPCTPINPSCRSDSFIVVDTMMKTPGAILLFAALLGLCAMLPVEGVDSPSVKAGVCPVSSTSCQVPIPTPKCTQDSDCPGTQKCCTPVCTRECTDITT
ncbi:hypothetical protein NDU88_011468, partial [Pleurodeles waltl]